MNVRFRLAVLAAWVLGMQCWQQSATAAEEPQVRPAPAAAAKADEPIDFERARGLLQKRRAGERLTPQEEAYLQRALEARRRGQGPRPVPPANLMRDTSALKPLTEMTADDRYKDEDGGLYGQGSSAPPPEHAKAAQAALSAIQPLDKEGKPASDGKIVLVSLSMSNATQEFSTFKRLADADSAKSPRVLVVDCAQGGQAMAEWAPPDARPWTEALRRIEAAGADPRQVQAAWVKLANKMPRGDLKEHGQKLRDDTVALLRNAKARFPNLRIAYLSSRIYGGYATTPLNPEPYAYESAFVVRWLIRDQIAGDKEHNAQADHGPVKTPLLLWGPYLWANGTTPRKADGLTYAREDLAGDGTHPSGSGREKVAGLLLEFFKTDPLARPWFAPRRQPAEGLPGEAPAGGSNR
ncbi:MAG: hypothetical protein BWX88_01284 [Planctomycetes bacterium ADurb.Bin126]|nr:MAG: hypothetical protein BWX88_01284 [Planctomycetes bacterium ADurb.Bin126]HOD82515.1 hypothetical protein [Phycisphaerae bacterium]HQL76169.1 hypothetical protein [Phycisphaerae bacterium]